MTKAKAKAKNEKIKGEEPRMENRAEVAKSLRSLANRVEAKGGEEVCLFFGFGDGGTIEGGVFCADDSAHRLLGIIEYTKSNLITDMIHAERSKSLASQLQGLVESVKAAQGEKH